MRVQLKRLPLKLLISGTTRLGVSLHLESLFQKYLDYNWSNAVFAMNTGHFTQVVWKSSTQLGIGVAPCEMQGYKVSLFL